MIVFVATFIVSTLFVAAASSRAATSRTARVVLGGIAVIIVSTFAGIRNLDMSVDMMVYGNNVFYSVAGTRNFGAAINAASTQLTDGEFGYIWLNYAVSRFTDDPHWFYFVLALASSSIVLVAIMLTSGYGAAGVMWLAYLCTAYVDGFNLLRQGVALAFAVLGISLVLRLNYARGLVVGLAGLLFHTSAIIFLPMWAATVYIRRRQNSGRAVALVIVATLAASIGASYLLELFGGILSGTKYVYYLETDTRAGLALGFETLYRVVPIVVAFVLIARGRKSQPEITTPADRVREDAPVAVGVLGRRPSGARPLAPSATSASAKALADINPSQSILVALTALLIIELVVLPIREIAFALYRVPLYFGAIRVLAYGVIVAQFRNHRALATIAAAVFVCVYFVLVIYGRGGVRYQSDILDQWFAP